MTVTLITGANKGIGFEAARQLVAAGHSVWIGARDLRRGTAAAAAIGARFVQLDVTDQASVTSALETIGDAEGRLDLLVNNAGVMGDGTHDEGNVLAVLDTNVAGVIRVTEAALPLLKRAARPVIVNVSSSMGSFWAVSNPDRPEHGLAAMVYGASKSATSMVTLHYAQQHPDVLVNAVEPGYTDTDMTRAMGGGRGVEESARVVVRVATPGSQAVTGTLQDEQGILAW